MAGLNLTKHRGVVTVSGWWTPLEDVMGEDIYTTGKRPECTLKIKSELKIQISL